MWRRVQQCPNFESSILICRPASVNGRWSAWKRCQIYWERDVLSNSGGRADKHVGCPKLPFQLHIWIKLMTLCSVGFYARTY